MKVKTKKKAKTWFNASIPAILFFEILVSGDFKRLIKDDESKLRKPSGGELERIWSNIYDEFYVLMDNRQLRMITETKQSILILSRRIETVKPVLFSMAKYQFTEEQLKELVLGLEINGIYINLNNNLTEEVHKAVTIDVPGMETGLEIELDNLEKLQKGEARTFEANCVLFEEYGYRVYNDDSLKLYIEKEKAVIRKAARLKQKNNKNE